MGRQTRIGRIADQLIEAGWLLALVFTPYFFNLLTARHFEPDKATTLRSLILLMLAAWAVKTIERITVLKERPRWRDWWRGPLAIPVLLYVGVFLLATLLSIDPGISWWGGYNRLQGTYTNLSYVALFALIVGNLRTREQLERIITAVILTSLAVAIYGLLQHAGLDPLPWKGDTAQRIASTMGNSIFVAAFLIMVIPFVLARLIAAAGRIRTATAATTSVDWLWLGAFILMLVAQQALMLGQLKFGAAARAPDFRYWWVFPGAMAIITGAFALTSSGQSSRGNRGLPIAVGAGLGLWIILVLLVYGASGDVRARDTAPLDPSVTNWWVWTLLGVFGIGSFVALNLFGPRRPEGSRIWEWAQVLGYAATLVVLFLAVLYSQSRGPMIGLIGGLLVFVDLFLLRRWRAAHGAASPFTGRWLGLLGAVTALQIVGVLFLIVFNLSNATVFTRLRQVPYVGRLGELTQTSDGTGRVRVLIWKGDGQGKGAIGLITANPFRTLVGYGPETMFTVYNPFYPPELARYEVRGASPDRSHQAQLDELVNKGALGLLSYIFLFLSAGWLAWRLLWRSSSTAFQLLYLACLATIIAHLMEGFTGIPIVSTLTMLWVTFALLIVGGRLDGQLTVNEAEAVPAEPVAAAVSSTAKTPAARRGARAGTAVRNSAKPAIQPAGGGSFRWVYALLIAVALFGVWSWNLKVVYADMYFNLAQSTVGQSDVQSAVSRYALTLRAVNLAPSEDYYYLHLGNALIQLGYNSKLRNAQTEADVAPPRPNQSFEDLFKDGTSDAAAVKTYQSNSGPQLLEYARIVLERAYTLSPTNKDHSANLGRLNSLWYQISNDPQRLTDALKWYSIAAKIAPNDVVILNEWASAQTLSGPSSYAEVEQKFIHSEQLDPHFLDTYVKLGNLYRLTKRLPEAGQQFAKMLESNADGMNSGDVTLDMAIASLKAEPESLRPMFDTLQAQINREMSLDELMKLPPDKQQSTRAAYSRVNSALGRIAAGMNDRATMEKSFARSIEMAPDSFQVRQQYTMVLSDTLQYDAALGQAQIGLQLAQTQQKTDAANQIKTLIATLQQRKVGGGR